MEYRIIATGFLALFLSGCVKVTTLDAELENKVVVEFILTTGSVQDLYLSLTKGPGEKEPSPLEDAEIKLIDVSLGVEKDRFVKVGDNHWTLDYSGMPGHKYRLEVSVEGHEPVWAEQEMPSARVPEKAQPGHTKSQKFHFYGSFYNILDMPEHMILRIAKQEEETGEFHFAEELCTDYPGVEDVNLTGRLYDGNPRWRTIGSDTETGLPVTDYSYYVRETEGRDGVWTYMFPDLIGKDLHRDFLLISRVEENHPALGDLHDFLGGKAFSVSGPFDMGEKNPAYRGYLICSSLSADYYAFLKDAYQMKKIREGGDLSSIYLRDNIYSNINGGLGIFGAMTTGSNEFNANSEDLAPLPFVFEW